MKRKRKVRIKAYSFEVKGKCVNFIENFANLNGYPIPGDQPFFRVKNTRISLPCNHTKNNIFEEYKSISIRNNLNYVKKESFLKFWRQYIPDIRVLTPRTHICKVCSDSLNAIMKVSYDDNELVQNYITHRNLAQNYENTTK